MTEILEEASLGVSKIKKIFFNSLFSLNFSTEVPIV